MNWWLRLRRRRRLEQDLGDEIAFHREMRSSDQDAALFGNETLIREQVRELWTLGWFESAAGDAIYALRSWRRNPAFASTIIASLALAIAAVIAIFTAADDLLFRPLPYANPDRLVMLWETNRNSSETARNAVSPDNFLDWKRRNSAFEDMAYVDEGRSVLNVGDRSEELHVQRVPPNFFNMLGVWALRGHLAREDESSSGGNSDTDVVISYRLWQSWFGGDPDVIGRRVQLDSLPRTVSAVMPPGFSFGDREVDLWPYMKIYPSAPHDRGARNMQAVARLRGNIGLGQAQAQMTAIARQLELSAPQFNKDWTVTVESLRDAFARKVRTSLLLLLASVSLLLLVACANAANLLLARYSARSPELAMRAALGADRWRLTRQLLTESLMLAAFSGVAGLVLGHYSLAGLVAIAPQTLTQTAQISIDWRIVLFAIGLSALTAVLFGLTPSIIGGRIGSVGEVRFVRSWRTVSRRSPRAWLIATEIALSLVLLTGGSLLFRSLLRLQHMDSGLRPRNVLTFHFRVMSPHDVVRFAQAISKIEKLPDVRSVSATSFLPFDGAAPATTVNINRHAGAKPGEELTATVRTVMPRYFETIGIPIRRGRDFSANDDTPQAPMRFVVNEAFVRKYLAGEDALSKAIRVGMARNNPLGQIIGVVGDVKEGSLGVAPVPTVYYVYAHMPYGQMTLVVRTERDPLMLVTSVRRVMRDVDPKLAVADVRTMEEILGDTYARERLLALLMASFSSCAVLLAAVGIYGILAYSVSLRTQEIGIRQAVGADASRIITMVLADGAWFVMAGLVAGTVVSLGLTRLLSSLLFETGVNDPMALALAAGILLIVAAVAAYIPAHRAAKLDPMRALRFE
ncbi:MAG TPA: ABC transporter permease [Bryobacteraceae bacterium]|nr:ABC transporter permease [Bryobacteraceae bacterium]